MIKKSQMEKKFVLVWLQKLSPGQSNDGPDESEIDLSSANFSLLKTTQVGLLSSVGCEFFTQAHRLDLLVKNGLRPAISPAQHVTLTQTLPPRAVGGQA
jgi:hypothetical protein